MELTMWRKKMESNEWSILQSFAITRPNFHLLLFSPSPILDKYIPQAVCPQNRKSEKTFFANNTKPYFLPKRVLATQPQFSSKSCWHCCSCLCWPVQLGTSSRCFSSSTPSYVASLAGELLFKTSFQSHSLTFTDVHMQCTCMHANKSTNNVPLFSSPGFLLPFRLPLHRIWKPTNPQKRKDRKYEEVTEV